jgi:hypothetical protein
MQKTRRQPTTTAGVKLLTLALGFLPMLANPPDTEAMQGEWFGTIYGEFDAAAITDAKATIKAG